MNRVTIDRLCKRHGDFRILDEVSFSVACGECFGVFGRSGAGKSLLLQILAGLETADSGSVSVGDGHLPLAPQLPCASEDTTVGEALWLYSAAYGIPRRKRASAIDALLAELGIEGVKERSVRELPVGMRKLVEVACVLLSPSDVILLDDPVQCLDSVMRARLWEYLLGVRARGEKAFIISTSMAHDAELCDRVLLLHEGRALAIGTVDELLDMVGPATFVVEAIDSSSEAPGITVHEDGKSLVVQLRDQLKHSAVRFCPRGLGEVLFRLSEENAK